MPGVAIKLRAKLLDRTPEVRAVCAVDRVAGRQLDLVTAGDAPIDERALRRRLRRRAPGRACMRSHQPVHGPARAIAGDQVHVAQRALGVLVDAAQP